MATMRDVIYKELLIRYRKDKIKNYICKEDTVLSKKPVEEIDAKVEQLWKENLENPSLTQGMCDFIMVEYSDKYDIKTLNDSKHEAKKRNKKTFRIVDIEKVDSTIITNFSIGISLRKVKKEFVEVADATGLFKIKFSDDSFIYFAKWISGGGKQRCVEGLFAAEKKVWFEFLKLMKGERKKLEKPKNGIFRICGNGYGGIEYSKLENLQETPIIHPSTNTLLQDITHYYSNVALFTRFGMSGVRKSLMVGPPGTGKTSLAIKIAKQFSKEKCVVFSTNISDIAMHLSICAKHKVSTLAILEDAESTLQNANSSLLNFLDGVDQPKNLLGSYIIMTTNFPERIEKRILQRPGRVDAIVEFGNLTGAYATKCAEIYFEDILFNSENNSNTKVGKELRKKLFPIVNGMSGAEIKELSQASASYAVSVGQEVVDVELIEIVKAKMKSNIDNISKYASEESSLLKTKKLGFFHEDNGFKEEYLEDVKMF